MKYVRATKILQENLHVLYIPNSTNEQPNELWEIVESYEYVSKCDTCFNIATSHNSSAYF